MQGRLLLLDSYLLEFILNILLSTVPSFCRFFRYAFKTIKAMFKEHLKAFAEIIDTWFDTASVTAAAADEKPFAAAAFFSMNP